MRRRGKWIPIGAVWTPNPIADLIDLDKLITQIRREARLWWMVEPPARVYRAELRTLADAWRRCTAGQNRRPTPKRRACGFTLSNQDVRVDGRRVRIPKIGWIKMCEPLRWRGEIKTARVSCESGRWHISLGVAFARQRRPAPGRSVGVDAGIKALAVMASADGEIVRTFANPRALDAERRRLMRRGRDVSRKVRGSRNWRKAVARLARCHARIRAVRLDATHKASTEIVRTAAWIGVEDLNVRGMMTRTRQPTGKHGRRRRRLARSLADANMAALLTRIGDKAGEAAGEVVTAPRHFASTRLCSACGERTDRIPRGYAGLRVRRWTCERCGADHDRDVNAARNLDPARWPDRNVAASCAETKNARGSACQSAADAAGGGRDEAGSAHARNSHAGAPTDRRIGRNRQRSQRQAQAP